MSDRAGPKSFAWNYVGLEKTGEEVTIVVGASGNPGSRPSLDFLGKSNPSVGFSSPTK